MLIKLRLLIVVSSAMSAFMVSTSCNLASTDPGAFSQKANTSVKKGMTKSEVRQILGNPVNVMTMNSNEIWSYSKRNLLRDMAPMGLAGQEQNNVSVTFNSQGRVITVNTIGTSHAPGAIFQ